MGRPRYAMIRSLSVVSQLVPMSLAGFTASMSLSFPWFSGSFFKPALVLSHLCVYPSESVSSSGLVKLDKQSWADSSSPAVHGREVRLNRWLPIFHGRSAES